jgi:hypothetical protein
LIFGDDLDQPVSSQFLFDEMRADRCTTKPMRHVTLSPNTGEKAVAHRDHVDRPFGMLGEHSLLSVNAVDERHPTNQYQQERYEIPFLQVVPDVCKYVREIHRMADESIGSIRYQTSQSRAHPEESSHSEKTNKAKSSRERY